MPRRKILAPRTVGEVLTELGGVYRDARKGRLDTLDASRLSAILNILRQTLESSELEERLCHLESLMDEKRDHKNTSEAAEVPRDQWPCLQGAGGSERNL
ncbi:MAG: hypothetical protein CMM53_08365 [Rhodospirillaceae bacterium]|nr:hypothetical protein [Rhodospirillaceae bacterium]